MTPSVETPLAAVERLPSDLLGGLQGCSEALAAIRRRAHVQRFVWQVRVTSR